MKTFLTEELINETIGIVSKQIMIAAKTAPKARGIETLSICMLTEKEKEDLATKMEQIAKRDSLDFFARDAKNIRNCSAVILIGTDNSVRGLNCALCGHNFCETKPKEQPCVFNEIDLGIAIGSAVSSAAQLKIDNRIMYSAGKTALEMKLMEEKITTIFAIPLSISSKNIFYDRK